MQKIFHFVRSISLTGLIAMLCWTFLNCIAYLCPSIILRIMQSPSTLLDKAPAFPLGLVVVLPRCALYVGAYIWLQKQLKTPNPNSTLLLAIVFAGIPVTALLMQLLDTLVKTTIAHLVGMAAFSALSTASAAISYFTLLIHTLAICALMAAVSAHWAACVKEP